MLDISWSKLISKSLFLYEVVIIFLTIRYYFYLSAESLTPNHPFNLNVSYWNKNNRLFWILFDEFVTEVCSVSKGRLRDENLAIKMLSVSSITKFVNIWTGFNSSRHDFSIYGLRTGG